ncbi:polysaccharide lyase [Afifella pfennigii]|uniref:polysaccharide lyase n=1 Tax=Afifella pfennigii TaxID=209897 RepID=UPI00047E4266|nr:polysaccharide lyase [Afifella pfennigii]
MQRAFGLAAAFVALSLSSPALGAEASPAHAYAAAALTEDFESGDLDAGGALFYKDNFEQRAGQFRFLDGAGKNGSRAIELSLSEHCPRPAEDCSERAELWEAKDRRLPYGTPVWYRFSVRFAGERPADDHRHVMAQWKRTVPKGVPGNSSPFLALRLREGQMFFTVETHLLDGERDGDGTARFPCAGEELAIWSRPYDAQSRGWLIAEAGEKPARHSEYDLCTRQIRIKRHLPALPEAREGWFDFAIFVKPDPEGDGRIEIFANDQHVVSVAGRIGHRDLGPDQYFKFGPYRDADEGSWTLIYDDFARSADCRDMLAQATCERLGL